MLANVYKCCLSSEDSDENKTILPRVIKYSPIIEEIIQKLKFWMPSGFKLHHSEQYTGFHYWKYALIKKKSEKNYKNRMQLTF